MPKYILNPNGNVLDLDTNTANATLDAIKSANNYTAKDFNFERKNLDVSFGIVSNFVSDDNLLDRDDFATVTAINDDKSFGFESNNKEYKIYKREGLDIFSVAENEELDPYYHEFEYQTGWRLPYNTQTSRFGFNLDLLQPVIVLFEVLLDNIVNIVLCETILAFNIGSNKGKKIITLGSRSFTEYDVFSRYVFDVLNYPKSNIQSDKDNVFLAFAKRLGNRLESFLFGFTSWLLPDVIIDITKIAGQDNKTHSLFSNIESLTILTDLIIDSFTNAHSMKRINLLRKKFYTQDYWTDEVLYKYKKRDALDYIADFTNYYRFKFAIERIHVGEKMSKYFYNKQSKESSSLADVGQIYIAGERLNSGIKAKFANIYAKYKIELSNNNYEKANLLKQELEDLYKTSRIVTSPVKYNKKRSLVNKLDKLTLNESLSIKRLPQIYQFNDVFSQLGKTKPNDDFVDQHKSDRIPIEFVNEVEKYLDAEYMPFYLHDTRNNELISFNAFIENITDNFTPEYSSTGGFGRIDDVKAYIKTTRTINVSFTIVSTQKDDHKDDHSAMWFQINKLISMLYPQWSKGEEFNFNGSKLEVPFSQVPTHSPLIRLRIGDVIKNNYSRFNLSRLFGIEGLKSEAPESKQDDTDLTINGDLASSLKVNNRKYTTYKQFLFDTKDYIKINRLDIEAFKYLYELNNIVTEISTKSSLYLKAIDIHNEKVKIYEKKETELDTSAVMFYYGKMLEYMRENKIEEKIDARILKYYGIEEQIFDPKDIKTRDDFMNPGSLRVINPITRAYESNMSKGLAGFITSLDVNYNESTWEIEPGSRAPIMVKITFGFAPIHDIPPGLDHHGMMRAPIYNVGDINNKYFGTSDKK